MFELCNAPLLLSTAVTVMMVLLINISDAGITWLWQRLRWWCC